MQSSIKDNPYSKQLYIFLSENRDQLFGNFAIECKDALDAAYHLSGKFLADKSDMALIRNHIALLCTVYPRLHTVILSIAWTMLSVLPKKDCLVDAIIGELHGEVKGGCHYHIWKTFLSAFLQKYGKVRIALPQYETTVIIATSDSQTAVATGGGHTVNTEECGKRTIHQTFVFPNVQQFNNNPQKVINISSLSEE